MGKILVAAGVVCLVLGSLLLLGGRLPLPGRLPGDIVIRREGFTVSIPLATSVLLSVLISLVLRAWRR